MFKLKWAHLFRVLGYSSTFLIISVLNKYSPSGPCTIGLGMLAFMILFLLACVLLLKNILQWIIKRKNRLWPTVIHFSFLVFVII